MWLFTVCAALAAPPTDPLMALAADLAAVRVAAGAPIAVLPGDPGTWAPPVLEAYAELADAQLVTGEWPTAALAAAPCAVRVEALVDGWWSVRTAGACGKTPPAWNLDDHGRRVSTVVMPPSFVAPPPLPAPAPAPAPVAAAVPAPAEATPPPADPTAAAQWSIAEALVAAKQWDEACDLLGRIGGSDDTHAVDAAEQIAWITAAVPDSRCARFTSAPAPAPAPVEAQAPAPRPDRGPRITTVVRLEATIGGAALIGTGFAAMSLVGEPEADIGPITSLGALGGGIGGYLLERSLRASEGQVMAVSTAGALGGAVGGLVAPTVLDDPDFARGVAPGIAVGIPVGVAGGVAAALALDPSAGQVALVRSGAEWGAATAAVIVVNSEAFGGFDPNTGRAIGLGGVLGGAGLGAALAAQPTVPSRLRVFLCDTSGLAGGLVGFVAGSAIDAGSTETTAAALGGAGAGLLVGYVATARMPAEAALAGLPQVSPALVRGAHRSVPGVSVAGAW